MISGNKPFLAHLLGLVAGSPHAQVLHNPPLALMAEPAKPSIHEAIREAFNTAAQIKSRPIFIGE